MLEKPFRSARIPRGFPGERLVILPDDVVQRALALPVCDTLCVTSTGRYDRAQGHYFDRPKGCPQHILIFCLAGRGVARMGGAKWRLRRGHGIILPAKIAHQYEADARDPWTIIWFHFIGGQADAYMRALNVTKARPRFWVQDADALAEAYEECYQHVLRGCADADLIGLATSFGRLLGLCRTLQRSPGARQQRAEERMVRIVRYLRENLHRKLTLAQIAKEAGLSAPHFCTMFKRQLKCGPLKFFERLKMQRACQLLERTEHRVSEIAAAVGIDDPFYFSRRFRRHTGASPSDYRDTSHARH